MDDTDVINLGFVIKNRAYREALVYSMQSRNRFFVPQHNDQMDQVEQAMYSDTHVLVCDDNIDTLSTFFHEMRVQDHPPRFILLLHSPDEQVIDKYISTGIHGFISFDEGLDKLEECITEVHAGRLYYPSQITQRFLNTLTDKFPYHTNIRNHSSALTPRQNTVIQLIETGCSNKDIARKLRIELATVKNHVHEILNKLNAKNRSEAVAIYRSNHGYSYQ